jgi:N-acyl-D-amino-acid deacylase
VKEAILVAETAGVPLVISHHKACGRDFWGKSKETLRLVEEAVSRGVKILLDQYPYEANMTSLNVCIPPWHFADGNERLMEKLADPAWRKIIADEMNAPDGGYDNFYRNSGGMSGVFVAVSPKVPEAEGMTVADYAAKIGKDPMDAYFDLLLANNGDGNGIYFSMNLEEVQTIYCHPNTIVGSDGLCFGLKESGHPRAWATFIRPLREFAEEKGLVSFEEAVAKQTSRTADFWGLHDRGRIAEGGVADLVLLDRKTLYDRADYRNSNEKADGVEAVYVSGTCIYRGKALTGATPGKLILREA